MYKKLTPSQLRLLLAAYGLTGVDTVSSFFGHGKRKVFKTIMQSAETFTDMSTIGDTLTLNQPQIQNATKFIGHIYGDKETTSLDLLRCARAQKGISVKRLPPTNNSFYQHLLRCVYQVFIWKHATVGNIHMPSPTEFGYYDNNGQMSPIMMTQEAAAPELINDIVCDCTDTCQSQCCCGIHNQPCTSACACTSNAAECICLNEYSLQVQADN